MRAPSVRPEVGDAVLAAVLVVAAQWELWLTGQSTPLFAAIALAGTAPLALRRRFPLTVVVVVMGAVVALTLAGTDVFSYAQLLSMLIATYTVAAHATAARAWAGLGVAVAAGVTNSVRTADPVEAGDVVFPLVLLAGPWLAGRALRLWRSRTAQLQRLTEELAHEREERAALAVAAERARIARELHDVLAQSMNVIVVNAEGAQEALAHDPSLAYRPLAKIQETGRAALRDTRRMLGMLRAPEENGSLGPLPGDRGPACARGGDAVFGPRCAPEGRRSTAAAAGGAGTFGVSDRPAVADQHGHARASESGGRRPDVRARVPADRRRRRRVRRRP